MVRPLIEYFTSFSDVSIEMRNGGIDDVHRDDLLRQYDCGRGQFLVNHPDYRDRVLALHRLEAENYDIELIEVLSKPVLEIRGWKVNNCVRAEVQVVFLAVNHGQVDCGDCAPDQLSKAIVVLEIHQKQMGGTPTRSRSACSTSSRINEERLVMKGKLARKIEKV